ncbi:MAG: hypothetical protein KIT09_21130 [Bryobacteraceae bacterium]|nr:hypothetical protein [Bryobacteraceae bacterium]
MLTTLRNALAAVLRRPILIAVLLAGNAAALLLFYAWLSIPERSALALTGSALILLGLAFGIVWLYGATLAAFQQPGASYAMVALRRLPRFLPWAVLLGAVAYGTAWLASKSRVPLWLAGPLVALLLLPLASEAAGGLLPAGSARRVLSRSGYWIAGAVAIVMGVVAPKLLLTWIPEVTGLTAQSASIVVRFTIAAALAALAWLTLAAIIGHAGRESRA